MNYKLLLWILPFTFMFSFTLHADQSFDDVFQKLEECREKCSEDCLSLTEKLSSLIDEFYGKCGESSSAYTMTMNTYSGCENLVPNRDGELECIHLVRQYGLEEDHINACSYFRGRNEKLKCLEVVGKSNLSKHALKACIEIMDSHEAECITTAGLGNGTDAGGIQACGKEMGGDDVELKCVKNVAERGLTRVEVDYCKKRHSDKESRLDCMKKI